MPKNVGTLHAYSKQMPDTNIDTTNDTTQVIDYRLDRMYWIWDVVLGMGVAYIAAG